MIRCLGGGNAFGLHQSQAELLQRLRHIADLVMTIAAEHLDVEFMRGDAAHLPGQRRHRAADIVTVSRPPPAHTAPQAAMAATISHQPVL